MTHWCVRVAVRRTTFYVATVWL